MDKLSNFLCITLTSSMYPFRLLSTLRGSPPKVRGHWEMGGSPEEHIKKWSCKSKTNILSVILLFYVTIATEVMKFIYHFFVMFRTRICNKGHMQFSISIEWRTGTEKTLSYQRKLWVDKQPDHQPRERNSLPVILGRHQRNLEEWTATYQNERKNTLIKIWTLKRFINKLTKHFQFKSKFTAV